MAQYSILELNDYSVEGDTENELPSESESDDNSSSKDKIYYCNIIKTL